MLAKGSLRTAKIAMAAALVAALLAVSVEPASARPAPRRGPKASARPVSKDGTRFVNGVVEGAGTNFLYVMGTRYDTAGARCVNTAEKAIAADSIPRGTKVNLKVRGEKVLVIVVFERNGIE